MPYNTLMNPFIASRVRFKIKIDNQSGPVNNESLATAPLYIVIKWHERSIGADNLCIFGKNGEKKQYTLFRSELK